MLRIAIILGSTRPQRKGEAVAQWVFDYAKQRGDADYALVDIAQFDLPLLDEAIPPSQHKYSKDHTKRWAETIAGFDGFVFVTPEYNHSTSAALKNALDFLYAEWNNKAAGFVSYGSAGGTRAVEHLRGIMAELQIADVRSQVALSLFTDFEKFSTFKPQALHQNSLKSMFDQLISWSGAMRTVRHPEEARGAAPGPDGSRTSPADRPA